MSAIKWSTAELIRQANEYEHVLDLGCGIGTTIKRVRAKRRIGIDAFPKTIELANQQASGVDFFCRDVSFSPDTTIPKTQVIYGIDFIEHLEKDRALDLLYVVKEHKASDLIMWFIPVGCHPQEKDDRGHGNDYYQTHRSTWYPKDMEALGYEVWHYPTWHKNIKPPKEKGAMWCRMKL